MKIYKYDYVRIHTQMAALPAMLRDGEIQNHIYKHASLRRYCPGQVMRVRIQRFNLSYVLP